MAGVIVRLNALLVLAWLSARRRARRRGPGPGETAQVRAIYQRLAERYDQAMRLPDRLLFAAGRAWVARQAAGETLELAIGTGRNLPEYPASVRVTGIDLSPAMLQQAVHREVALGREVNLVVGDAESLPFPEERFDTVVVTLGLCTIPNERAALQEVKRVLRPGGRLLLLEHVRSDVLPVRLVQRLVDPLFVRLQADHLLREPLDAVTAEGFMVEWQDRSGWGIVERLAARKQP